MVTDVPSLQRTPVPPLLQVQGLTVYYGSRVALADVDLNIASGQVMALAGENGAGKSTLVRCVAGDLAPTAGEIMIDGNRVRSIPGAVARLGVAVVWQDLALCDNLDVASNLLLGRETRRLMRSDARFHSVARDLIESLDIPLSDTTALAGSLSGGQRQLLAVARAMRDRPRLLILDEPTASLGVIEARQVERLTRRLTDEGTTILLISHDIDQMFRLADRVCVLRHGRVAADVSTAAAYPDEIVGMISGQPVDSSPRRQLDRLHSLVGRLTSVEPSSSLAVILSALGTALAADRLCIHLVDTDRLRLTAAVGMPAGLRTDWAELPLSREGGPTGAAAALRSTVVDEDIRAAPSWARYREAAENAGIRSSWAVPVMGSSGLLGVITVFRRNRGVPHRDEIDLVTLYAGYAASAAERDRLLGEVTARNRVLETIRVVLEELAVSMPLGDGLGLVVDTLRDGLDAAEVAVLGRQADGQEPPGSPGHQPPGSPGHQPPGSAGLQLRCRAWSEYRNREFVARPDLVDITDAVATAYTEPRVISRVNAERQLLAAAIPMLDGPLALVATWPLAGGAPDDNAMGLLEDAARSIQLALERETSERANRETVALRRSQELQRAFLSRLSHELRTPLTAIHGYADSLLQTDVNWDAESKTRFLSRIATESARLGRLVGDLLDLSAIESNILRLHRDWCEIGLILDAARDCLPLTAIERVRIDCVDLPSVWADHDRLEQVLVNLMDNAIRHNPPDTKVVATATGIAESVTITVADDGIGLFDAGSDRPGPADEQRRTTAGAGLGLSIARAIIAAHGGTLNLDSQAHGTCWRIELPVDGGDHDFAPETLVVTVDG